MPGEDLGTAILKLGTDNTGLTKGLKKGEKQSKTAMQRMTTAFKKNRKAIGVGMVATGAAVAALGFLAVKGFAEFEQGIARAGALSGATADQMKILTDTAREMGRTTVFTATQAAGALSFLAQAGFSVTESTEALPGVLELAAAAQIDLATAADITSNVLSGYGLEVKDLTRVNDVLTKAFTSSNTDLLQLGQAMKFAGPIANAAGVEFEETAAALGIMGNAGIQASMAGTTLRGAISRLLNPTNEASDAMKALGFNALDSEGNLRSLVDIVADLEEKGLSAGDALTIFGQRAGPGMLTLIDQGSDSLRDFRDALRDSGGTAAGIAARQLDTFQGAMTLLGSAITDVQITIGAGLAPAIRSLVEKVSPIIQQVGEWMAKHQKLTTVIAFAVLGLGALTIALGAILIILPGLSIALALLAGASGIGLVILATTALVAVVTLLVVKWDFVWAHIKGVTETVGNFLVDMFNKMTFVQRKFIATMLEGLKAVLNVASKIPGVGDKFASMASAIQVAIDTVDRGVPNFELMTDAVKSVGESASDTAEEMKGLSGAVVESTETAINALEDFGEVSGEVLRRAGQAELTYAETVEEVNKKIVQDLAERIQDRQRWAESDAQILKDAAAADLEALDQRSQGWDRFFQTLNPTMQKIKDLNLSFGDIVAQMATKFGIDTQAMGQRLSEMGVKFGDTFALMTAFGDKWLGNFLSSLDQAKGAATGGGNPGGGGPTENQRQAGFNIQQNINALISTLGTLQAGSQPWLDLKARIAALFERLREIPGFAQGGVVSGPTGTPQLAVVHGGETVIPAGGGTGTTIIFQGDVFGFEDFERRVASIAVRQQRRGAA